MNNQKFLRKGNVRNKETGITLIALVVTIIVLLILAAVSITMLTGENSGLRMAQSSKAYNIVGAAKDEVSLAYNAAFAEYLTNKYGQSVTEDDIYFGKIMAKELGKNVYRKKPFNNRSRMG